jgi:hypothetical protein
VVTRRQAKRLRRGPASQTLHGMSCGRPGLPARLSAPDVRTAVESAFGDIRRELQKLVRIPSVSAASFPPRHVRESAEATAEWLKFSGLRDVRLLEVKGAHPAVFGATPGWIPYGAALRTS